MAGNSSAGSTTTISATTSFVYTNTIPYNVLLDCDFRMPNTTSLKGSIYGDQFELAAILQLAVDFFLLALQVLFIKGAIHRCGWKSNFSFSLLVMISFLSFQMYLFDLIGVCFSILAEQKAMIWESFLTQRIFRIIGSCNMTPQCFTLLLNSCLTIHRIIFVIFPTKAPHILTPHISKIISTILLVLHLSVCVLWSSDLMGMRYSPSYLATANRGGLPYTCYLQIVVQQANILMLFNTVLYSILIAYILIARKMAIQGNDEIRFTFQAFLSILLEMSLFCFYYFYAANPADPWYAFLLRTVAQQVFAAAPSIIYLIFNRDVRNTAFGRREASEIHSLHSSQH